MFWLTRPPYWRWFLAGIVIAVAVYMDLTGPPTEPYPFVAEAAAAGEVIQIEWRSVPRGLLPDPEPLPPRAWRPLDPDSPLVPGLAGDAPRFPAGWWALEVDLPTAAVAGAVMVALRNPDIDVTGVIVEAATAGNFGVQSPGLVAFPPENAAAVAAALAEDRATLLIAP